MKVKATKSFSGLVNMAKGSIRDLPEGPILSDLLSCGYVECIEQDKPRPELEVPADILKEEPDASAAEPVPEEPKKKPVRKKTEKG